MRSRDQGQTWHRLFDGFDTTVVGVEGSLNAGYLYECADGRLLASLHWVDRSDPSLPLSNPVTSGVLPMKYLLSESRDGGCTWSSPRHVSLAPHPGSNPTGEILELEDARLMLSYESWKDWDAPTGKQSANVKFSSDAGDTWSDPVTMASDPDGPLYYWDNHVTIHRPSGRPLTAFWTHNAERGQDASIHLAWGSADGNTWTPPEPTGIEGQVATPLFLDEDRLLLVYVHRHDPGSIRVVLSENRGETWQLDNELFVYASPAPGQAGMGESRSEADYWCDMVRWTFGHPKAVALPDGCVLVAYYAPPDSHEVRDSTPPLGIHWAKLHVGGEAGPPMRG